MTRFPENGRGTHQPFGHHASRQMRIAGTRARRAILSRLHDVLFSPRQFAARLPPPPTPPSVPDRPRDTRSVVTYVDPYMSVIETALRGHEDSGRISSGDSNFRRSLRKMVLNERLETNGGKSVPCYTKRNYKIRLWS